MKDPIWTVSSIETKEQLLAICPHCRKARLSILAFKEQITQDGRELNNMGYPHGIEHFFTGFLNCSNCDQIVTVSGILLKNIEKSGYRENGQFVEYFTDNYIPHYFHPNLRYFEIPEQIPREISQVIDLAFHHYFKDVHASANKIRTAIELILDDIKAPKRRYNKKRKLVKFNNLHDRIENFSKRSKYISMLMLANKYIGNDGSHFGNVDKKGLLDAYENLEEILDKLYIKKSKTLAFKAKSLIDSRKNNK